MIIKSYEMHGCEWMRWDDVKTLLTQIEQRYGIVIEYRENTTPAALAPSLDADARAAREPGRDEPRRATLQQELRDGSWSTSEPRRDIERDLRDDRARMRRARRPIW